MVVISNRYVGHVIGNKYGHGTGPTWLTNVVCSETCPTDLSHCSYSGWGSSYCRYSAVVSIACYDRTTTAELPEPTTTTTVHTTRKH